VSQPRAWPIWAIRETTFVCLAQEDTGIRVQPYTDRANADLPPLAVRVYNNGALRRSSLNSRRCAVSNRNASNGEAIPSKIDFVVAVEAGSLG
jgi:hypothetical protein